MPCPAIPLIVPISPSTMSGFGPVTGAPGATGAPGPGVAVAVPADPPVVGVPALAARRSRGEPAASAGVFPPGVPEGGAATRALVDGPAEASGALDFTPTAGAVPAWGPGTYH